jgi:hypothetical protein
MQAYLQSNNILFSLDKKTTILPCSHALTSAPPVRLWEFASHAFWKIFFNQIKRKKIIEKFIYC